MANATYCYVVINGERKYFGDYELGRANEAAQTEANHTGKAVKRQNSWDVGHSLFYPQVRARKEVR
jgi:hypothetical protein